MTCGLLNITYYSNYYSNDLYNRYRLIVFCATVQLILLSLGNGWRYLVTPFGLHFARFFDFSLLCIAIHVAIGVSSTWCRSHWSRQPVSQRLLQVASSMYVCLYMFCVVVSVAWLIFYQICCSTVCNVPIISNCVCVWKIVASKAGALLLPLSPVIRRSQKFNQKTTSVNKWVTWAALVSLPLQFSSVFLSSCSTRIFVLFLGCAVLLAVFRQFQLKIADGRA